MDLVYHSTNFMLKVIDTILRTNIHVHGEHYISKEAPTLFVANHFTRFETLLMPYVIQKYTDVPVRSLADKSLFVGLLGTYLEESGTLSTANRYRNEIVIGDLMSARKNWLIYPEGSMVKNKKVTKEKEFILHTPFRHAGIYTGAAMMALKAQMMKLEYRAAQREQRSDILDSYNETYYLKEDELTYQSTIITPVNISYMPLRPGKNPMMSMAALFAGETASEAMMEELEIEGNLLSDAEIHITFDKAIDMAYYLHEAKQSSKVEDVSELRKSHHTILQVHRHALTTRCMDTVYKNVMISFDHLFIAVLMEYRFETLTVDQLRRAIYFAAGEIVSLDIYNIHDEIDKALIVLLSKESHPAFESALRLAIDQKILLRTRVDIYRINKSAMLDNHTFNDIRVKNTLRVVWNEIALLDAFRESVHESMQRQPCEIAEAVFYSIYREDLQIYKEDYNQFYSVIASKPKEIGRPFILFDPEYTTGIIFAHGYKSAPEEVREMAEYLHKQGINVYGVRIKGHGTMPEDLRDTTHEQWYESFERAYAAMRQVCKNLYVGGFSTGGLLALLVASKKAERIDGVVCINSAMKLKDIRAHYVVPTFNVLNDFLALFDAGIEYVESEPENPHIDYAKHYLSSVGQLKELMKLVYASLPDITVPALIIQSKSDPVVNSQSGTMILERIRSKEKRLSEPDLSRHVIITGKGKEVVFKEIAFFLHQSDASHPRRREDD